MKTSILSSALIAASLGFTLPASAENQMADAPAPTGGVSASQAPVMQITVNLPASMRPLLSDDIAEVFAGHVADSLRQHGFTAQVHYVDPFDNPPADQPLLAINLVEWQVDRSGNVNCTFSATLKTPKGRNDLGLFTGVGMGIIPRPDWFLLDDQFEDAARQALSDLYPRMVNTHLLSP
jgi:hypothetical protein